MSKYMSHRHFLPTLRDKLNELRSENPDVFKSNGALKPGPARDEYVAWYLATRATEIEGHDRTMPIEYYNKQALELARWLYKQDNNQLQNDPIHMEDSTNVDEAVEAAAPETDHLAYP